MFLGRRRAISLYFDTDVSNITRNRRGSVAPVSWLENCPKEPLGNNQVRLSDVYLPPTVFLEREVTIPKGAEKNTRSIIELDMVRRTPFRSNDVLWAHSKQDRNGRVIQWVAKKSDIQHILKNLAGNHISVRQVFVDVPNTTAAVAMFDTGDSRLLNFMRTLNFGLAALTVAFLLFAWLFPTWKLSGNIGVIETQTEGLRAQALQTRADVDQFRAVETSKAELLTLLRERPKLSGVLRDLTVALPDTTWSDNMVFTSERVVFSGTTEASAAELVLGLARSKQFENPRLSGPVSRTSTGGERFEIAAELRAN